MALLSLRSRFVGGGQRPQRIEIYHKGRWVSRARLVVESRIGRSLDSCEEIHHVNGDTLDDSFDNLKILSKSEHARLHHKERDWSFLKGVSAAPFSDEHRKKLSEAKIGSKNPAWKGDSAKERSIKWREWNRRRREAADG